MPISRGASVKSGFAKLLPQICSQGRSRDLAAAKARYNSRVDGQEMSAKIERERDKSTDVGIGYLGYEEHPCPHWVLDAGEPVTGTE